MIMENSNRKAFIITAPSGAGKSTIISYLKDVFDCLEFSISATTRPPRENEKQGVHYYFLSLTNFKKKVEKKEFLEWEEVYSGTYYGTLKSELDRVWSLRKYPIFDVDVLGALNIMRVINSGVAMSIFIDVKSIDVLKSRLMARGSESAESLKTRLKKANHELSFKKKFDKIVLNENLTDACRDIKTMIENHIK